LLVQRPGELVTREDLRSRLWPAHTFVDFEHGLNTAVKKLRQALDDSADEPRYVETLPRRGYRFLAAVTPDGALAAVEPQQTLRGGAPAAASTELPPAPLALRRRVTLGVLLAIVVVGAFLWRFGPSGRHAPPAVNAVPVIVLMDSPLPGRVYDPRTVVAGGTNADDLTDALRDLPVVIEKENTSPMWHREAQVLRQSPDLIISHLSCLFDERATPGNAAVLQPFFDAAVDRLVSFFGYIATNNPRTRFLIYSRGRFEAYGGPDKFLKDTEARFPVLRGRVATWTVPGGRLKATFRDSETARVVRARVKSMLGLS
jgi:hypothetical protein